MRGRVRFNWSGCDLCIRTFKSPPDDSNSKTRFSMEGVELLSNEKLRRTQATGPDERTCYSDTISQKEEKTLEVNIEMQAFLFTKQQQQEL